MLPRSLVLLVSFAFASADFVDAFVVVVGGFASKYGCYDRCWEMLFVMIDYGLWMSLTLTCYWIVLPLIRMKTTMMVSAIDGC